jgi:hypothetical protein
MFGWLKGKDTELWKDLMKLLDLVQTKLSKLEAEVELINGKLRKRIYKDDPEVDADEDQDLGKPTKEIDDGFNELRTLRKTL